MRARTLFLFLLLPAALRGGDSTVVSLVRDDFLATLRGTGRYFSAPFRKGGVEWCAVGGVAAATGGVMLLDRRIREEVGIPGRGDFNGDLWDVPTFYGDVVGVTAMGTALYLFGLAAGEDEVRVTGRLAMQSLLTAAVTSYGIRIVTGRSRPFTGDGPGRFGWFEFSHAHQSFPSGHTTAAFALSTVLAERIGTTWSRIGFYSIAAWTGVSRIRNDRHWGSDVVLGAAIGFSAGWSAVRGEEEERATGRLEIVPSGGGLTFLYHLP